MRVENIRLVTSICEESGVPVVKAAGEVDVYTLEDFRAAIDRALDGGAKRLIVDLSDVGYMDSGGFGTLLGATKRLRPRDGTIDLVGCSDAILRMLSITRLDTVFGVYGSVDAALEALSE